MLDLAVIIVTWNVSALIVDALDHCAHDKPTSSLLAHGSHQTFCDQNVDGGLGLFWREANFIRKRCPYAVVELDTRTIAQVDIEHEAQRLMKIMMIAQSAGRLKGDDLIAILLEKPMHALQHGRIIINDENGFAARQGAGLSWLFQMHGCGKRGDWVGETSWVGNIPIFPADAYAVS